MTCLLTFVSFEIIIPFLESHGKLLGELQYLCEPFSALLLFLHAERALCNTSCMYYRSILHSQSENVTAYMRSGGGTMLRRVCMHNRSTVKQISLPEVCKTSFI